MIYLPSMNPEVVSKEIQKFILNTVNQHKKSGVVLGLSGGIDSSVVAVLCLKAFEETSHIVMGYYLPHQSDDDSRFFVDQLIHAFPAIRDQWKNISRICSASINIAEEGGIPIPLTNYQKGNVYSRVRANVLSTFAEKENKVLSGTGNRDEDYGVGYYTLFGDGAVHMNPIGCLSKRLVYQMAEYLEIPKSIIKRTPTAGLEPNQTDFDDLGYEYSTVEIIMEALDQGADVPHIIEILESKIIVFSYDKFKTMADIVQDVLSRHFIALSKSKIIHPPIPTVTLHYGYAELLLC